MNDSQIFSLLSELFSLTARLEPGTTETVRKYIFAHFKGTTQDGLLLILDGLDQLREDSEMHPSPGQPVESTRERISSSTSTPVEVLTREFRAMLLDSTFLPSKSETLALFKKVFGDSVAARMVGSKDSRQEIIERAIRMFKDLDDDERRQIFQNTRSIYLRGRHSSLEQWSDIITKGE